MRPRGAAAWIAAIVGSLSLAVATPALAHPYPSRPIKLVVTF
jgi:hypothetical protein